jgi:hypothetical protein
MTRRHDRSELQYALVSRGAIVCLSEPPSGRPKDGDFSDEYPGDSQWLPIVNIDSQPFDEAKHRRLTPYYQVNGDCVNRIYPVIERVEK